MSDDHKHDELKVCKTCLYAGMDFGRQTTLAEVKKVVEAQPFTGGNKYDDLGKLIDRQTILQALDTLSTKGE